LREMIETETYPGSNCVSDDDIIGAYDRNGSCGYHAVGTCRMGKDAESVVDPQLRIYGVDRLRVIDASVMPTIVSGNTNAATIMIAEKGADFLLADARAH